MRALAAILAACSMALTAAAIEFTPLEYGIIAQTGSDTGALWHSRGTTSHPAQVLTRDWIDLYLALTERCHATQTAHGSNAIRVVTNTGAAYEYTNSLAGITNSAGGPFFNWMTGPATNTTTNAVLDFWRLRDTIVTMTNAEAFTYTMPPPKYVSHYRARGTNRFLWGPARSVTAAGFNSTYNRTYYHWRRDSRPWIILDVARINISFQTGQGYAGLDRDLVFDVDVDIYTNPGNSAIFVDFGPQSGMPIAYFQYYTANPPFEYMKRLISPMPNAYALIPSTNDLYTPTDPFVGPPDPLYDFASGINHRSIRSTNVTWRSILGSYPFTSAGQVSPAGLMTNLWRDAYVNPFIEVTNLFLYAEPGQSLERSGLVYRDMPAQLIVDWMTRPQKIGIYGGTEAEQSGSPMLLYDGKYADDNQATAGAFIGFTNALPYIEPSELWTRLAIGSTNSASVYFSFQSSNRTYTAVNSEAKGRSYMWELTNGYYRTGHVGEVQHALEALRWTATNMAAWSGLDTSNTYHWIGSSTTGWDEAKGIAETSAPALTASDSAPYRYTAGAITYAGASTTYHAYARSRRAALITDGVYRGRTNHTDFYARARTNTADPSGGTIRSNVFSAYTDGVTNWLKRYSAISNNYGMGAITSAWLGATGFPPAWCGPPLTDRAGSLNKSNTTHGYTIVDADQVFKWSFRYGLFP